MPSVHQPSVKSQNAIQRDDFRYLWWVGSATFLIRWLEILVFGIYAYEVTESALIVTALTMARVVPLGLFGALFGVIGERVVRFHALLSMVVILLISQLVLCYIGYTDQLQVWHLAVASFINGTAWAADNPIRRTMIGDVVGEARMNRAMSIEIGTSNGSRMLGPTLGGLLLLHTGILGAFALAAILYATALWAVFQVSYRNSPQRDSGSVIDSLTSAWSTLKRVPRFIGVLWVTILFNLFAWPVVSLVPVVAADHLHLAADTTGYLASMDGLGALLIALFLIPLKGSLWHGKIYVTGFLLFLLMLPLFATTGNVIVAGAALFLIGCGQSGFAIMQGTLTYSLAPVGRRSEAMGIMTTCIGFGPAGFIMVGLLAEVFGARVTMLTCCALGLLVTWLSWRTWKSVW